MALSPEEKQLIIKACEEDIRLVVFDGNEGVYLDITGVEFSETTQGKTIIIYAE